MKMKQRLNQAQYNNLMHTGIDVLRTWYIHQDAWKMNDNEGKRKIWEAFQHYKKFLPCSLFSFFNRNNDISQFKFKEGTSEPELKDLISQMKGILNDRFDLVLIYDPLPKKLPVIDNFQLLNEYSKYQKVAYASTFTLAAGGLIGGAIMLSLCSNPAFMMVLCVASILAVTLLILSAINKEIADDLKFLSIPTLG